MFRNATQYIAKIEIKHVIYVLRLCKNDTIKTIKNFNKNYKNLNMFEVFQILIITICQGDGLQLGFFICGDSLIIGAEKRKYLDICVQAVVPLNIVTGELDGKNPAYTSNKFFLQKFQISSAEII